MGLFEVASTFYDLEGGMATDRDPCKEEIRKIRKQIRMENCHMARAALKRRMWALSRVLQKRSAARQLTSLKRFGAQELFTPTSFWIDGQWNFDRQKRLQEALRFSQGWFTDPANPLEWQYERLRELNMISLSTSGGMQSHLQN